MKILIAIFSVFYLSALKTSAQENLPVHKGREYYVEDFTSKVNISPFAFKSSNMFTLQGKGRLDYEPNDYLSLGIRFMHKWLGFAYSYAPKNLQERLKGTTTYTNFQLNSYGKKMGFDIYYLGYSGYYISNTRQLEELRTLVPKNEFIKRPDIATISIGTNIYYIYNHKKYSYRSTFVQNEIQKHSAGSFMLSASFSYYNISADSSIVPAAFVNVENEARLRRGDFYSLCFMPGYGHTFVISNGFFITLSLFGGLNIQQQHYFVDISSKQFDKAAFIPRVMGRGGIGYNSKKFYCGIMSIGDDYVVPLSKGEKLTYLVGSASFYLGFRFNVPKSMQKYSNKLDAVPALFMIQKNN